MSRMIIQQSKNTFPSMFWYFWVLAVIDCVLKIIWGHCWDFDKIWQCWTFVDIIKNVFCRHPPHLLTLNYARQIFSERIIWLNVTSSCSVINGLLFLFLRWILFELILWYSEGACQCLPGEHGKYTWHVEI